jgi:DNA-binding NarL/FixJ family response regulator
MALDVMIVDDSQSFLDAARDLLERQGLRVVGLASTSAEAMRRSAELHPDVVLIDITLAGESGFELAQQLSARDSGAAALILISTHSGGRLRRPYRRKPRGGVPAQVRAVRGCDPPNRRRRFRH